MISDDMTYQYLSFVVIVHDSGFFILNADANQRKNNRQNNDSTVGAESSES